MELGGVEAAGQDVVVYTLNCTSGTTYTLDVNFGAKNRSAAFVDISALDADEKARGLYCVTTNAYNSYQGMELNTLGYKKGYNGDSFTFEPVTGAGFKFNFTWNAGDTGLSSLTYRFIFSGWRNGWVK